MRRFTWDSRPQALANSAVQRTRQGVSGETVYQHVWQQSASGHFAEGP